MRRRSKFLSLFFPVVFLLFVLNVDTVSAADELFLTGIVKRIDPERHLVTVEVKSESCTGTMTFRIEDVSQLVASEGKKISFSTDTSICNPNEVHSMHGIIFHRGYYP